MENFVRCRHCLRLFNSKGIASHYAAHRRNDTKKLESRLNFLNGIYSVGDKLQWRITKFDKYETLTLKVPFFIRNGQLLFQSYERTSVLSADEEFLKTLLMYRTSKTSK